MSAGEAQAGARAAAVVHRERRPPAIVGLAQQALVGADLPALMQEAAALELPYAAVWEAEPGGATLRPRAGVGWPSRSWPTGRS